MLNKVKSQYFWKRKKIVAGNWKMNLSLLEAFALASEINAMVNDEVIHDVTVIIAPPFPYLQSVRQLTKDNPKIHTAAQNCSSETKGAFTGEVSAEMLQSLGTEYVIIGHSERRNYFKEDNQLLAKKVKTVLSAGLIPIYCCGETLQERNGNKYFEIIKIQLEEGLFYLSKKEFSTIVIAYEPVWAIGTGVTASPQQVQEMHQYIRSLINEKYGKEIADNLSILYGGSCNSKNAKELFANADVDGGLIGGASLKSRDFTDIIKTL